MRMVSLLITLLVLAFVIVQLLGGGGGGHDKAAATQARIDEDKAKQVEAVVLKSAQAQDHSLNMAEGGNNAGPGGPGSPATGNLNGLNQQIQAGQQVQGAPQQGEGGQQQNP